MDVGSTPRERSHGKIPANSVGALHPRATPVPRSSPGQPRKSKRWLNVAAYSSMEIRGGRKHAGQPQNRVRVTLVALNLAAQLHGRLSPRLTPDNRVAVSVSNWQLCVRDIEGHGSVGVQGLSSSLRTHRHDVRHARSRLWNVVLKKSGGWQAGREMQRHRPRPR